MYKLATHHATQTLGLASLCLTMLHILPPCIIIFRRTRKHLVLLTFTRCAWAFFLCSYQVHEKNVLLPLAPMTALLGGRHGERAATKPWVGFANTVAARSLYHLLIGEVLQVAYWPILGVWLYMMDPPPFSFEVYRVPSEWDGPSRLAEANHLAAYVTFALWHGFLLLLLVVFVVATRR